MYTEKIQNFLRKDGKSLKANIAAVFVAGVILILFGNSFMKLDNNKPSVAKETLEAPEASNKNEYEDLEKRMSSIFSKIEGAGEVEVMITLKSGSEIIIAQDEKQSERKGENNSETNVERKATLMESTGGTNTPIVLKENSPEIEGVVIIAQGGDNVVVRNALTKGAQALLNVPAHKVEVFKMEKK